MKKAPERKPYPAWKAFRQAIARAILFLLLCCAFPARASQQLPTDIRIQFGNVEIVDTACWEGPESNWFVLVRTPDKMNRLLCYTRENGTWIQRFQTSSAVPQGPERVRIVITDKVQDFVNDRTWPGPILMILQYGSGQYEDAVMLHYAFIRSGPEEWELFSAFFAEEQVELEITDDSITFRTPVDQDHSEIHTVQGVFERDLRRVSFTDIPRSPQQAQDLNRE